MDKRIKVSILDDEKSYRHAIKRILSRDERIVVFGEHSTGNEFIKSLNSPFKPDVCLLDIKLPGEISGIDCAIKVKEKHPNIQIIFITSHPNSQTLMEAKRLEANYIEKGTIGEVLIDKIVTSVKHQEQLISLQHNIERRYSEKFISFLPKLEETQKHAQELTDLQRKIMKLRQDDRTIEEISKMLNMKPNTVATHIRRALQKLRLPDPLKFIDLDYTIHSV